MNRASPAHLRQAIESAHEMVKAGILFVPMPAASVEEAVKLRDQAVQRLEEIAAQTEGEAS